MFTPVKYGEQCLLLQLEPPISDEMGGFSSSAWKEILEFTALIDHSSSLKTQMAEQQGVTSTYTIYVDCMLDIQVMDVFQRVSDRQTFRITSAPIDQMTPSKSRMNFKVFSAEKYQLPKSQ